MTRTLPLIDDQVPPRDDDAGFGTLECGHGRLPLIAMDVRTAIADLTARTTIRQTFRNSLSETIEATYIFPLPDRAAVTSFRLRVADRTIEGQLKERAEAREEYDRAIEKGRRAAITEEERSGVFTLRVGNLPPNESATVELTLVGPLAVSAGEATFRFPLVVAPRYTPGIPLDGPSVGDGTAVDTDQVPDASRVTPPVLLPGFPNPVRLNMAVTFDAATASDLEWFDRVHSSLHATVTGTATPRTVTLQPGERLDRDFILRFPVAGSHVAARMTATPAKSDRPGLFALTLVPPEPSTAAMRKRDVVFVVDRSGSMGGWKMVAARRAVGRMIDSLLDQDRFALLAFDNSIEQPSDGFVAGTNRQRWKALEWLGGIEARGGTELGAAVATAASMFRTGEAEGDAERIIVVVTDGQVSGEDVVLRQFSRETGQHPPRVFTIGIDRAVNAGFLRRLADLGGGQCELVESEDRLDACMQSIQRLIGRPVLTDVQLSSTSVDLVSGSIAPAQIPDLFPDRPITIYGQHLSAAAEFDLHVSATLPDGEPWRAIAAARPVEPELLTPMWGRARVRDLEDTYAAGQSRDREQLQKEIVATSLDCHVLSRFTAYVAVDEAEVINQGGLQHRITQPVEAPAGWASLARGGGVRRRKAAGWRYRQSALLSPRSVESHLTDFAEDAMESIEVTGALYEQSPVDPDSSPIARLIRLLLNEAVAMNATEVLIEPTSEGIIVKFVIDGRFVERDHPPRRLLPDFVSRFRTIARLPATPQEETGTAEMTLQDQEFACAITITPTSEGEAIRIVLNRKADTPDSPRKGTRKKFWT
jgi:Ca-activated chloride channel family protein